MNSKVQQFENQFRDKYVSVKDMSTYVELFLNDINQDKNIYSTFSKRFFDFLPYQHLPVRLRELTTAYFDYPIEQFNLSSQLLNTLQRHAGDLETISQHTIPWLKRLPDEKSYAHFSESEKHHALIIVEAYTTLQAIKGFNQLENEEDQNYLLQQLINQAFAPPLFRDTIEQLQTIQQDYHDSVTFNGAMIRKPGCRLSQLITVKDAQQLQQAILNEYRQTLIDRQSLIRECVKLFEANNSANDKSQVNRDNIIKTLQNLDDEYSQLIKKEPIYLDDDKALLEKFQTITKNLQLNNNAGVFDKILRLLNKIADKLRWFYKWWDPKYQIKLSITGAIDYLSETAQALKPAGFWSKTQTFVHKNHENKKTDKNGEKRSVF